MIQFAHQLRVLCCERPPRADPGAARLDWNSDPVAEVAALDQAESVGPGPLADAA
jgi:hypothetical protein